MSVTSVTGVSVVSHRSVSGAFPECSCLCASRLLLRLYSKTCKPFAHRITRGRVGTRSRAGQGGRGGRGGEGGASAAGPSGAAAADGGTQPTQRVHAPDAESEDDEYDETAELIAAMGADDSAEEEAGGGDDDDDEHELDEVELDAASPPATDEDEDAQE